MQEAKTLFATKPSSPDLKVKRANEYATPTLNARITKAYSVSFPVRIVSSQLSNISRSGQIRQVSRTTIAVIRETRDRMVSSIAQQVPKAVSKTYERSPKFCGCKLAGSDGIRACDLLRDRKAF